MKVRAGPSEGGASQMFHVKQTLPEHGRSHVASRSAVTRARRDAVGGCVSATATRVRGRKQNSHPAGHGRRGRWCWSKWERDDGANRRLSSWVLVRGGMFHVKPISSPADVLPLGGDGAVGW